MASMSRRTALATPTAQKRQGVLRGKTTAPKARAVKACPTDEGMPVLDDPELSRHGNRTAARLQRLPSADVIRGEPGDWTRFWPSQYYRCRLPTTRAVAVLAPEPTTRRSDRVATTSAACPAVAPVVTCRAFALRHEPASHFARTSQPEANALN